MGTELERGADLAEGGQRLRQRRLVLHGGFLLLTSLLLLSIVIALNVQRSLSQNTEQIYEAHVLHDELVHRLRRTLWFGATAVREYLLNPMPDRTQTFERQLAPLKSELQALLAQLEMISSNERATRSLITTVESYWSVLDAAPTTTRLMTPEQRYDFIKSEVAPRRNAASDLVREFAAMDRIALEESQRAFQAARGRSTERLLFLLGLAAICGAAVTVLSLLHSGRLERDAARHFRDVDRSKRELERLSIRLMEVQEEERARLARELHDEIGQTLATLRMEITRTNGTRTADGTDRARMLVDRAVRSIRDLSLLLRPPILDDLGLSPALQWQAEDFAARTGVHVDFEEGELSPNLPEAVRTCVYRVLQESLHNCEKHAAATAVHIRLEQDGQQLTLTVRDNGRGFADERARPSGLGLVGMRERAQSLNGVLIVESSAGAGTTLTLRVPVTPAESGLIGVASCR